MLNREALEEPRDRPVTFSTKRGSISLHART